MSSVTVLFIYFIRVFYFVQLFHGFMFSNCFYFMFLYLNERAEKATFRVFRTKTRIRTEHRRQQFL